MFMIKRMKYLLVLSVFLKVLSHSCNIHALKIAHIFPIALDTNTQVWKALILKHSDGGRFSFYTIQSSSDIEPIANDLVKFLTGKKSLNKGFVADSKRLADQLYFIPIDNCQADKLFENVKNNLVNYGQAYQSVIGFEWVPLEHLPITRRDAFRALTENKEIACILAKSDWQTIRKKVYKKVD